MPKYYVLNPLKQITGPHTKEYIRRRAELNPSFYVAGEQLAEWTPIDTLMEFFGGTPLDDHAQPQENRFNAARVMERSLDELLGLCKGIISDGVVHPKEATYLKAWLDKNHEVAGMWPADVLAARIQDIFLDGKVIEEERSDLGELLGKITGETPGASDAERHATRLPLDDPEPEVVFDQTTFCFTGKFLFGVRRKIEKAVAERGSMAQDNPTRDTDYLVIGTVASRDWAHTTHGRKIERVLENREKGAATAIISEEHWTSFL